MKDENLEQSLGIKYSRRQRQRPPLQDTPNIPFAGGYLDFIKHPEPGLNVPEGPPRTSILEDLCFYWRKHRSKLPEELGPETVTVFLQKIVASNYMQLIDFVRTNISTLEFQLSRRSNLSSIQTPWIEERWSDLQSWYRRCSEYIEEVEEIMRVLGIPYSTPFLSQHDADWTSCRTDFQVIHYRLKTLRSRVEMSINSITGLAGIAGNGQALIEAKRSLKEAKNIKALTLIGMVFIPLAYSTGLFSMNDRYLPGTALFWVYFAVSVPLIVVVSLVAYLMGFGYNDEGDWNFKTLFKSLRSLRPGGVNPLRESPV
jgi:CorA-like Mg2+ transporter protein